MPETLDAPQTSQPTIVKSSGPTQVKNKSQSVIDLRTTPATQPIGQVPKPAGNAPAPPNTLERMRENNPLQKMKEDIRKRAEAKAAPPKPTQPIADPPKGGKELTQTEAPPPTETPNPPGELEPEETTTETPEAKESAPQSQPEAKKPSPWKIADQYKAQARKLEQELADLKTSILPEADRKSITEKMAKVEEENKSLRDEIRFVNYSKSPEFVEKFHQPYQQAIQNAMVELGGVKVTDASGNTREITDNDLMAIVTADMVSAKQLATELFGEFAPEVMSHRTEIRKLMMNRQAALDDWKKNGEKHLQEQIREREAQVSKLQEQIGKTWKGASESLLSDERYGRYFSPVEGDQEGNQRLAKGYELVDRAFQEDPRDPKLTPEQRSTIVKRHAAVKHRAAAFGRLVYQLDQANEQIEQLKKDLNGFKESEPETTGTRQHTEAPAVTGLDGVKKILRERYARSR